VNCLLMTLGSNLENYFFNVPELILADLYFSWWLSFRSASPEKVPEKAAVRFALLSLWLALALVAAVAAADMRVLKFAPEMPPSAPVCTAWHLAAAPGDPNL
jgi:hypothetical protein